MHDGYCSLSIILKQVFLIVLIGGSWLLPTRTLEGQEPVLDLEGLQRPARAAAIIEFVETQADSHPQTAFDAGSQERDFVYKESSEDQRIRFEIAMSRAAWWSGDLDESIRYAGSAAEAARDLELVQQEFEAMTLLSAVRRRKGDLVAALESALRMQRLASTAGDKARAFSTTGLAYRSLKDPQAALESFVAALEIMKDDPEPKSLAVLMANISRVYADLEDFEEAAKYTRDALDWTARSSEFSARDETYFRINLGGYLLKLGAYEEAVVHLEKSREFVESTGDVGETAIYALGSLSIALAQTGRHDEAVENLEVALNIAQKSNEPYWLTAIHFSKASTYQVIELLSEAREAAEAGLRFADDAGPRADSLRARLLSLLSSIHRESGDLEAALDTLAEAQEVGKKVDDELGSIRFAEWRARLQSARTELDLTEALLAQESQKSQLVMERAWRYVLISVTILVLVCALVVLWSHRKQRSANRALEQAHADLKNQKEQLESALSQVNLLAGLLPICCQCKSIRGDDGYWREVEEYLADHSEATFTHGVCPECAEALFPELY